MVKRKPVINDSYPALIIPEEMLKTQMELIEQERQEELENTNRTGQATREAAGVQNKRKKNDNTEH